MPPPPPLSIGVPVLLAMSVAGEGGGDPLDWLRNAVPGEPGVDYPILPAIQVTQVPSAYINPFRSITMLALSTLFMTQTNKHCICLHIVNKQTNNFVNVRPQYYILPLGRTLLNYKCKVLRVDGVYHWNKCDLIPDQLGHRSDVITQ